MLRPASAARTATSRGELTDRVLSKVESERSHRPVGDEDVLASRLAVGSSRIVKAITLDPPLATDDTVVPRDKPEIRR